MFFFQKCREISLTNKMSANDQQNNYSTILESNLLRSLPHTCRIIPNRLSFIHLNPPRTLVPTEHWKVHRRSNGYLSQGQPWHHIRWRWTIPKEYVQCKRREYPEKKTIEFHCIIPLPSLAFYQPFAIVNYKRSENSTIPDSLRGSVG